MFQLTQIDLLNRLMVLIIFVYFSILSPLKQLLTESETVNECYAHWSDTYTTQLSLQSHKAAPI